MASLRSRTMAPKPRPVSSKSKREDSYTDTCCEECGSGECPSELLLCDKCDCGFHHFCLRPILASVPKGSWVGPSCSDHKKKPKSPGRHLSNDERLTSL